MDQKQLQFAKKQILDIVKSNDNFVILASDPDDDAVGSSLALEEILKQLGKKVVVYTSFDLSAFRHFPNVKNIQHTDVYKLDFGQYDVAIILDAAALVRILDKRHLFEKFQFPEKLLTINIDHHKSNKLYGNINYLDLDSSATGEELYDIFSGLIDTTPNIATNLLAAIIGDTGCFKYINTSAKVLKIASELMQKGADHQKIIKNLYYSMPENIFKANQDAVNSIKIKKVGKTRYAYAIFDTKKHSIKEHQRNQRLIAQEAIQAIKDTDFTVIFVPLAKKLTKLSFRSNASKYSVREIAEYFNGGGHDVAAGGQAELSIKDTIKELDKYLEGK